MFREKLLLMGGPGVGKSRQLCNVYKNLAAQGVNCHVLDLEDKLQAFMESEGVPLPKSFHVLLDWTEVRDAVDNLIPIEPSTQSIVKPGDWILIDRWDLAWDYVQNWATREKYEEDLAQRLMGKAKGLKSKEPMDIPRFSEGFWQVVNEEYRSPLHRLFYRSRCNVLITTGIRVPRRGEDSPFDVFGHIGVNPRGQKELPHQPNTVVLLYQMKAGDKIEWMMRTAKDLPNRVWFNEEPCEDFFLQYVDLYWEGEKARI